MNILNSEDSVCVTQAACLVRDLPRATTDKYYADFYEAANASTTCATILILPM